MLMTERQLLMIIRNSILLEEQRKEEGKENNEDLASVVDDLKELPANFLSKVEKAVEKDVESTEDQPMGDEAALIMATAALVSGPMILKGLKWIAKQIAKGLGKLGLNDAGEDAWWTGLPLDDPNCWYNKWQHFYQDNCEVFGTLILKLGGVDEPTDYQKKQAGNVVFLTCCIIMGVMSFGGLMHALHDHQLWSICGEATLSCIEYGEVVMLLNTICAVALGETSAIDPSAIG